MKLAELILKYIEVLIWPLVTVFILMYFKDELSKLFSRAKKVELPGGISIEAFENKLEKAKQLDREIKSERKPEITELIAKHNNETEANKRMIELGLKPSPSGLDLDYYRSLAKTDIQLAMAGLRMDLELMIRNLAQGFKIKTTDMEPINKVLKSLLDHGAVNTKQVDFMKIIFQLTNYAIHGGQINQEQVESVLELGETLVEDYVAWLDWGFQS
jgi:hypothetical protein